MTIANKRSGKIPVQLLKSSDVAMLGDVFLIDRNLCAFVVNDYIILCEHKYQIKKIVNFENVLIVKVKKELKG